MKGSHHKHELLKILSFFIWPLLVPVFACVYASHKLIERRKTHLFRSERNSERKVSNCYQGELKLLRTSSIVLLLARMSSASSSSLTSASSSRFSNTEELPIDLHRHTILERIRHERVVIIHGETGCGKSSRLPQFLLEDALERGEVAVFLH
jgi:HrpA-like RNA helicase